MLQEKIATAVDSIRRVLSSSQLSVSWSHGKDSSVVLGLVMQAALAMKRSGQSIQSILVVHGDTLVDNPEIRLSADHEIRRIKHFAVRHEIPVEVIVAQPYLSESWACRVIGGRALPSFPGTNRDCSTEMKVNPITRVRKTVAGNGGRNVTTVIGTRFEESPQRAARMRERGETSDRPWVGDDGAMYLSPIAEWTMDDVWWYLGLCRGGDPDVMTFSDFEDVFRIYSATAGTGCAVVADMATKGKSSPCGLRTGCWCCVAVGRDRSLEAMLDGDPRYGYLRGLNHLQRFLVKTRWDLARRNWFGRTVDQDGYVAIAPDVYSPDMLKQLLRYTLSLQADELEWSMENDMAPRFKIIDSRTLLAIDAMWNLQGYHAPFEALQVYQDIFMEGKRYRVPDVMEFERPKKMPKPRWLFVGLDWEKNTRLIGLRDLVQELVSDGNSYCMGTRNTRDGRTVMDVERGLSFDFDHDSTLDFFEFEFDRVLKDRDSGVFYGPTAGYLYYARMGMMSLAPQAISTVDEILRRTWWKHKNGLFGQQHPKDLLKRSMAFRQIDMFRDLLAA